MRLTHRLSAALILAGMAVFSLPAHAQIQDIIDGIGFGPDKEAIEYRERAPLVVPPSMNMREPEQRSPDQRAAKWPNDPDVARKRAEAEEARKPRVFAGLGNNQAAGLLLSNEELRKGRIPGAETGGDSYHSKNANGYDLDLDSQGRISPDRLRAQGEAFKGTVDPPQTPGVEPKRRYLTDPPTGARAAATGAPLVATTEKAANIDEESSPYAFFKKITGNDD